MVVKLTQSHLTGIQSHMNTRHCIGYVVSGTKHIYNSDFRQTANRGDLFYLGTGIHYTEEIPDYNKPYEQIAFYYTPQDISRILSQLNMNYGLEITNGHNCENCHGKNEVVYTAWNYAKTFFISTVQYVKDRAFSGNDHIAENLKLTELAYIIMTHPECCLKSKLLGDCDMMNESFEQIIHRNIFNNISIEELAIMCNRSLTSFKKEFKEHFFESPHRWFIKQRLIQSRLLLISTNRPISEIGNECLFPNTSHFIKLFKKEYGITPAAYRNMHSTHGKKEKVAKLV